MKIVQVTPRYPPRVGGVETHVKEISERLVERGHEVTILSADAGSDVNNREERNGVIVRRYRGFAPSGAFHAAPGIIRAVRKIEADVVHAHNYHSFPMLLAALGADAPLVVTPHYHGRSASGIRDYLLRAYQPLGGWALRKAQSVVAVSEWECDLLDSNFNVAATIIPNGLELERFQNATSIERERPYLLCVGRLEEYKGVQHIIRALGLIKGYDLLIAGSGCYRSNLERIAQQEGVANRVQFLGYVPDEDLPRRYAGASVYLSLSEFEAYGLTVAEALASGTPCVVRAAGALEDWVGNSGVVCVDTPAPEAVTEAVVDAKEREPETESIFDWDTVVDQLEDIYLTA